jgi:hypothetical protein
MGNPSSPSLDNVICPSNLLTAERVGIEVLLRPKATLKDRAALIDLRDEDVRKGSEADISASFCKVRFTPRADILSVEIDVR